MARGSGLRALRVGIFGGTFNPIHVGHLLLAETAREQLALDRVVFIPTARPPHKRARDLVPGAARLRLIELAIRHHPAFAVSDVELHRQGPSYTLDTVRMLHARLPEAALFLLIGEDMLAVRWLGWDELKRLCTIVAARRPGTKPSRSSRGVRWLSMPQVEVASSDIRARLKAGRSIRYLVPAAVERHIRQHNLYQK